MSHESSNVSWFASPSWVEKKAGGIDKALCSIKALPEPTMNLWQIKVAGVYMDLEYKWDNDSKDTCRIRKPKDRKKVQFNFVMLS